MDRAIYTALDANINRCIEGIRVCEEIFRFGYREEFSSELKGLRHRIAVLVSAIPAENLLGSRDVAEDAQKFVNTSSEMMRGGLSDIFRSNIRRAIEAARVIEEFSKSINPEVADGFQHIRFSLYDFEKRGWMSIGKKSRLEKMRYSLYAIIDSLFVRDADMEETARILAGSGADIIQLRMKNAAAVDYLAMAERISTVCRNSGVLFAVNDRPDIACLVGADILHIGQEDVPPSRAREIAGESMIIGLSVKDEAETAASDGADYIAAGPVFPTASKDGNVIDGIGLEILRNICSQTDKPAAAIGGINDKNAVDVLDTGILSLSVISVLYRDGRIAENTERLKKIITDYGSGR